MKRAQQNDIAEDLACKYVFIGGPRQAGKTTISRQLYDPKVVQYLNYDLASDRRVIIKGEWSRDVELVILDEFHKYPTWKTFLKGYYDTEGVQPPILVTGSAKLNVFKKGNDSMTGRYFYHRLLPLSVNELSETLPAMKACELLLRFGNFPEPFLSQSERTSNRWRNQYFDRIIREDVTDLSNVQSLPKIQLLIDMLRERVGASVSYASIARDIQIAPKTVKEWIDLLEQLYVVFRVTPFHHNIARSLLKEPKIYFFDPLMAFDKSAHLENLVAVSMLKHLWYIEDTEGHSVKLYYLRTKDGKEIDFLSVINKMPTDLVEVKHSDDKVSPAFAYFGRCLPNTRNYQIVYKLRQPKTVANISVQSVGAYLSKLKI